MPTPETMEQDFRRMLQDAGLPEPDEFERRSDGSVVALWHEKQVAVVIEPDPAAA